MFYFDPMYLIFMLPALVLAFYAQMKVAERVREVDEGARTPAA